MLMLTRCTKSLIRFWPPLCSTKYLPQAVERILHRLPRGLSQGFAPVMSLNVAGLSVWKPTDQIGILFFFSYNDNFVFLRNTAKPSAAEFPVTSFLPLKQTGWMSLYWAAMWEQFFHSKGCSLYHGRIWNWTWRLPVPSLCNTLQLWVSSAAIKVVPVVPPLYQSLGKKTWLSRYFQTVN